MQNTTQIQEALTVINESVLAKYLDTWFKTKFKDERNFLTRNPIAQVIKSHLLKVKRWKIRGGGNPKKGFLQMKENGNFKPIQEQNKDVW